MLYEKEYGVPLSGDDNYLTDQLKTVGNLIDGRIYPKHGEDCNLILVEGTKNGKSGIKILEPLIVHDAYGDYTDEVKKLFRG